jgi:hypothetical membrane protein
MNHRDLAGWAGMIGSALFVTVFTIEGWLRPGYDAVATFVSELSLGTRGWIQSGNFLVLGVLFLVFTQGVRAEFRDGKASRAGPILLGIIGMSLFASGIFVTDPATTLRLLRTYSAAELAAVLRYLEDGHDLQRAHARRIRELETSQRSAKRGARR